MHRAPRATPSVIAYGDATFPKGTASAVAARFPAQSKGVPLGELAANEVSRLRGYSLPFPATTPPVKMGYRNARRRFCTPKFKIILPLNMARAQAEAIPNRHSTINSVPAVMRAQPMRLLAVKGSCSTTKASARVMTTLSLSMGTTLDAAPTCKAW